MGRVLKILIPLALMVFGLTWPVVLNGNPQAGDVDDPVVISNFRAEFVVNADGGLDAVETITGDFPSGRHGIFRHWDVANQNNPALRQEPQIQEVLQDGQPANYRMLWENDRFRVAKIGDPDRTLDVGSHEFTIRYSIPGVLDTGDIGANRRFAESTGPAGESPSVFFWNVVAPSWNNEIRRADISITLPGTVGQVQCSVGFGVGRGCDSLTSSGNTVELSAVDLAPRTPVTVRAGVDVPTPPQVTVPWSQKWDGVWGRSVTGVAWILGMTVVAAAAALLWLRTTLERSPGFPLQYAPPPGLGPVQTEYIRTETVPRNGLTATLFYLAERRLVDLRQISPDHWEIKGTAERKAWLDVDPVSVAVGSALDIMGPGAEFEAKKSANSGEKLSTAKSDMAAAVEKWAIDGGLLVKRRKELWLTIANAISFIVAVCGFFGWGFPSTMWGLPFAAFFLFSIGSWRSGVGTRRTEAGRELWSRAGGFHRMLATDSAESRFDFAARKDLYTAYIPFAVACGAAALWAQKYQVATGYPAPQPDWYNSSSSTGWGFVGASGGSNFDSFESALTSSIGAYTATQSSSSSSSGGGGFSGGGGGGGGGGGSW